MENDCYDFCQSLESEIGGLKSEIETLEGEKDALTHSVQELEREVDDLEERVEDLRTNNIGLEDERDTAIVYIYNKEEELESMKDKINELIDLPLIKYELIKDSYRQ